jgi:ParB family chromosome partitioning protein
MMPQQTKRRLGRGLAALIGEEVKEDSPSQPAKPFRQVPIEFLHANPNNPRKAFRKEELEDLAHSIRERGLLQPILARTRPDGRSFEIVAGERRWRAAQLAGIHEVPVVVRELSDGEALEVALIENIQRTDLNALEEARAYAQLMEQFAYTQQQLADSLGKSRSHVANTLRLLTLPDEVKRFIEDGSLTAGHARSLIAAERPLELASEIMKMGLSVRGAEKLSRDRTEALAGVQTRASKRDPNIREVEQSLEEATGLRVQIRDAGMKGGRLIIHYKNVEQLDELCRRLRRRN